MALVLVTEANDSKPMHGDRKITVNTDYIVKIEPLNPGDIGKSMIYLKTGHPLQVHETQQQIMQSAR